MDRTPVTGESAHSSTAGNYAHSSTAGNYAHSSTAGKNSVSSGLGYDNKAKAATGGAIVLTCLDSEYNILAIRAAKVGENGIKPDTWYSLDKDGNFIEHIGIANLSGKGIWPNAPMHITSVWYLTGFAA